MGFHDNRKRIFEKFAEGKTRQEIYTAFSEKSPEQSGKIAFAIASLPTEPLQRKYSLVNLLLFSLLVGYSLLNLTSYFTVHKIPSLVLFLKISIPLIFAFYVYYFHGGLYRLLLIWSAIDLIQAIFREPSYSKFFLLSCILILAIFISYKIFPHCGLFGPKRDSAGNYRLE